jgi:hypothetical protein
MPVAGFPSQFWQYTSTGHYPEGATAKEFYITGMLLWVSIAARTINYQINAWGNQALQINAGFGWTHPERVLSHVSKPESHGDATIAGFGFLFSLFRSSRLAYTPQTTEIF